MNGERVTLPRVAWGLLWTILFAVLGGTFSGAWFASSLSERTDANAAAIIALTSELRAHEAMRGHPGIIERLESEHERVTDISRRLEKIPR